VTNREAGQALDLDELRELCAVHLAGQWANDGSELYRGECAEHNLGWVAETCDIELPDYGASTGSFIAAAVNALPVLLAEVERLRAERDRLEQQTAQALRIAQEETRSHEDGHPANYTALMDIQRILGVPDDETEENQ
jgi:hypothetical protein